MVIMKEQNAIARATELSAENINSEILEDNKKTFVPKLTKYTVIAKRQMFITCVSIVNNKTIPGKKFLPDRGTVP